MTDITVGVPVPPPNGEPAVRVHELCKNFGSLRALDRVSFDIPNNTVFGLVGPNGAGKTTLFSLAAGFLKADGGHIEVLGIDVEDISELRGRLSILPQDALFQANVPILEQLVFFGQLAGLSRIKAREEALQALGIVGLEEVARKNPGALSHGMAKRLGIAQAFLGVPEVIILDEPTSGLDPFNARGIRQLIRDLRRTGTVVISSHNLREIQELCTHVAIIDRGRLIECSDVESVTQATKQVRISFSRDMREEERNVVRSVAGVIRITQDEHEGEYIIHFDLAAANRKQDEVIGEIVQKLLAFGLVPRSINEGASLEARFLEVTRDEDEDRRRRDYSRRRDEDYDRRRDELGGRGRREDDDRGRRPDDRDDRGRRPDDRYRD